MSILFRSAVFIFLLLFPVFVSGQEYSYAHYDTKDGLAGSTVYRCCQDKDGFLWFATDAGVSRFDGSHFRNFTTADGLPESEILTIGTDKSGRIWIIPFKNTICYYYKGRMHTAANDSAIARLHLNAPVYHLLSNNEGHTFFLLDDGRVVIAYNDAVTDSVHFEKPNWKPLIAVMPNFSDKGFLLAFLDGMYVYDQHKLSLWKSINFRVPQHSSFSFSRNKDVLINTHPDGCLTTTVDVIRHDSLVRTAFFNTLEGSYMSDSLDLNRIEATFLKGVRVSYSLVDQEKNLWFTTMGEGVYKLASREFKSLRFIGRGTSEVWSLNKMGNTVLAGTGFGSMYSVNGSTIDSVNYDVYNNMTPNIRGDSKLRQILRTKDNTLYLIYDEFILRKGWQKDHVTFLRSLKHLIEKDDSTLLLATGKSALSLNKADMSVRDTIWDHRSTAIAFYNNRYFVGTTNGLYIVNKDRSFTHPGKQHRALDFRTIGFAIARDNMIWIATSGGGLVGMKDDQVVHHITMQQGLSSDICRSLFLEGNMLWVGTDKGLNKIDLSKQLSSIIHYTTSDGLPSDIINAVYADSNMVYIGSPAGFTFFNEAKVSNFSRCDLRLLSITVAGRPMAEQSVYELPHSNNSLKVEFVGISFKSGGDILYRYRLKGLNDEWDSTRQNLLEFPSLPSGNYTLELVAINKFGVVSNTLLIPLLIATPIWQAWWFKVFIIVLTMVLTAALASWRFSIFRKRTREKLRLQQKVHDLEQMALRSQMNPHFIFNCLNSIQHFIIKNDLETTNQYLTEFAHLIRQTMDNAEKGTISITREVLYLSRYIDLERMRFGNSFSYSITVAPSIDKDFVYIPSMILQPYVENSIRHGIRNRTDGQGMIHIKFEELSDSLLCIVEDNGIGRQKAASLKSPVHVEYQSKGMSLTAERIQVLNRQYGETVSIEIIDLTNEEGQPSGTKIVVTFPNNLLIKLA